MSEWNEHSLGEVCSRLRSGSNITAKDIHESGSFPVFGGNGIRGYAAEANFSGECAIIGRQGAYCGNVRYFIGEARMSEHAVVACAGPSHHTRFLAYLLSNLNLGSLSGQAAQPGLSVKVLAQQSVRMPSRQNQERIAAILGAYDDLIVVNRRRVAVLEEMARGLFEEWFVRFRFPGQGTSPLRNRGRYPLPEGWEMVSLEQLCVEKNGIQTGPFGSQLHQEDYAETGVPVVMPKNIVDLRVVTDGIARIPQELADGLGRHVMREGDIVYGRRGEIGRRAYISDREEGFFCGTGCLRIRPNQSEVVPHYLFMALGTHETDGAIKARATGATMPNLSVGVMKDVPVLRPCKMIQDQFGRIIEPIKKQAGILIDTNQRLAVSRDLLLPRLVSGQFSVELAERELDAA